MGISYSLMPLVLAARLITGGVFSATLSARDEARVVATVTYSNKPEASVLRDY